MRVGFKGSARAPKHEDANTSSSNAPQVFIPYVCNSRGFSCNCETTEYVPPADQLCYSDFKNIGDDALCTRCVFRVPCACAAEEREK